MSDCFFRSEKEYSNHSSSQEDSKRSDTHCSSEEAKVSGSRAKMWELEGTYPVIF